MVVNDDDGELEVLLSQVIGQHTNYSILGKTRFDDLRKELTSFKR